jgi:hypothetical protein
MYLSNAAVLSFATRHITLIGGEERELREKGF